MSMTRQEKIDVITAHVDGKVIEIRNHTKDDKWSVVCRPNFDSFDTADYRVKPEPREGWLFPGQLWSREELSEENMKGVIFVREVLPRPEGAQ